jgi:hypothetical protein
LFELGYTAHSDHGGAKLLTLLEETMKKLFAMFMAGVIVLPLTMSTLTYAQDSAAPAAGTTTTTKKKTTKVKKEKKAKEPKAEKKAKAKKGDKDGMSGM